MMEWQLWSVPLITFSSIIAFLHLYSYRRRRLLPPGPPGFPVIGNLGDILGPCPHKPISEMRSKYGDVVRLRLGSIDSVAILSSRAATELFKTHHASLTDRTRSHSYCDSSVSPYGPYWLAMHRLVAVDLLIARGIGESVSFRQKGVDEMLAWIEDTSAAGKTVHVAQLVIMMLFKLLGNLTMSEDMVLGAVSEESPEVLEGMGLMEWRRRHSNVSDVLPWLKLVDSQGLRRKMERSLGKAFHVACDNFVKKEKRDDFLDVFLQCQGNEKYEPRQISDQDLNIFILVSYYLFIMIFKKSVYRC